MPSLGPNDLILYILNFFLTWICICIWYFPTAKYCRYVDEILSQPRLPSNGSTLDHQPPGCATEPHSIGAPVSGACVTHLFIVPESPQPHINTLGTKETSDTKETSNPIFYFFFQARQEHHQFQIVSNMVAGDAWSQGISSHDIVPA